MSFIHRVSHGYRFDKYVFDFDYTLKEINRLWSKSALTKVVLVQRNRGGGGTINDPTICYSDPYLR